MARAHIQRRDEFRAVHKKLKTVTVILHTLQQIVQALKDNVEPAGIHGIFLSGMDTMLGEAWAEQVLISW